MLYLDSSAIVKLVAPEPETAGLVELLRSDSETVSSALARVEVVRAARRTGATPDRLNRARAVLDRIALVPIDGSILDRSSDLRPAELRTLDAIHLATALSLRPDITGVVTYDARLTEAATTMDLSVLAPS